MAHPPLFAYIRDGLRRHLSPEQTCGRLKRGHGDNRNMRACHETIYQAIDVQAKGTLKLDPQQAPRSGRTARKPQGDTDARTPRFRDPMIMIGGRPAGIEDRAIPGHWEGYLIVGSRNKSAIGTLVERATRFTGVLHLPDRHDAQSVQQTPASENTNGLLRQYFPKGAGPSIRLESHLDTVAGEPDDRPRNPPRLHETQRKNHRTHRPNLIPSNHQQATNRCKHHQKPLSQVKFLGFN